MSGETKSAVSAWTIDSLKEYIETRIHDLERSHVSLREINDERDRLYKERDDSRRTAVDAALTAVKEQTKASFEASEKAIVKAEDAQKSYNQSHNDLARKMDDQGKGTMPRSETESRFRSLEEKINEVKSAISTGGGRSAGLNQMWGYIVGALGLLLTILMLFDRFSK